MFYSKQRGSTLIVAIFVITVMAVFAAAMIRIDWSGQDMTSREVFSTRAWYAAHSGNEYVLSKLFPLDQKASIPAACTHYSLNAAAFSCQRVTVTCTPSQYRDNGQLAYKYQLESTATCGTGQFETTRIQETWAKDLTNHD